MSFADWGKPENRDLAHRWISTVSLAHNPKDGLLYCGFTAYDNDIIATFDMETRTFRSLGFQKIGDRFDVKVHRSLEIGDDGTVYAASACLHDLEQRADAAGGKIFSYDPGRRSSRCSELRSRTTTSRPSRSTGNGRSSTGSPTRWGTPSGSTSAAARRGTSGWSRRRHTRR